MKKRITASMFLVITIGLMALEASSQTRIRFTRGRTSATLTTLLAPRASRTYALFARNGQVMTATVSSPKDCVKFSNASTTITVQTDAGDNFLTLDNACRSRSAYTLIVSINY